MRLLRAIFLCLLAFLLFTTGSALAAYRPDAVPNPRAANAARHVSDPEGVLKAEERLRLEERLASMEAAGKAQVAVAVLPAIEGDEPRRFANELFARWGIGHKDKDNGLLILLVTRKPRSITFETGYGLEGTLTDVICDRIQEGMLPSLRAKRWGDALYLAAGAVDDMLEPGAIAVPLRPVKTPQPAPDSLGHRLSRYGEELFLLACFVIFMILHKLWKRRPSLCPACGLREFRRKKRVVMRSATTLSEGLERIQCACASCGHQTEEDRTIPKVRVSSSGSSWRGGSSRGGSRSGGWGGGRSGGGGSSRRF